MRNLHKVKWIIILCAMMILLTMSCGMAQTVEPKQHQFPDNPGGMEFAATVKPYDEEKHCFPVIVYDEDVYDRERIDSLKRGDVVLFFDTEHNVKSIGTSPMGTLAITFDDFEEILFSNGEEGTYTARSAYDDMICMHVWETLNLPPAENITLTDTSDVERLEPVVTTGLEAINRILRQREEESIGFDYSVTTIRLNEAGEIAEIRVVYAPWQ